MDPKTIINKYLNRNKDIINSLEIVHSMNAAVLLKSDFAEFELKDIVLKELNDYCKDKGYEIEKVFLAVLFDSNIKQDVKGVKLRTDSRIFIVPHGEKYAAVVVMGSYIEIK